MALKNNFPDNSVLIIDDDSWMQRVLSKIFGKMNINEVYSASNGFSGVNYAIENSPDVIFLDLMMPEIDGITTLKMLKSLRVTEKIPIIVITANSDFESLGAVLASGAAEFVAKPFTYTTIMEKLHKVLDKINQDKLVLRSDGDELVTGSFDYDTLDEDDYRFFKQFEIAGNSANANDTHIQTQQSNNRKDEFVNKYMQDKKEYSNEIKKILQK